MWIKSIELKNFRNYKEQKISLDKNINIFFGENAQGKTNILEAIYLGSIGKSFRAKRDNEMINIGKENSYIKLEYEKKDRDGKIEIELGRKKIIYYNGIKLKKLSEILGNINIVIFTPDDIEILKGGPQNRRKFLDIMISQLRPNYMYLLNLYSKTIEQRNNYLRQIKELKKDPQLLDIWDEKIIEYSNKISKYRNEFIEKIKNKIKIIHKEITNNEEEIEIKYITDSLDIENFKKDVVSKGKLKLYSSLASAKAYENSNSLIFITNNSFAYSILIIQENIAELENIYEEKYGVHKNVIIRLKEEKKDDSTKIEKILMKNDVNYTSLD